MNRTVWKGEAILLLAAVLWGSCFIFQKEGMDYIEPFTLGAFRFLIGGLVLLPVIFFLSKSKKSREDTGSSPKEAQKTLWHGGILCGIALFAAASLQQIGLVSTTAGKAAFLTSMEIVAVELIGIFIAKKIRLNSVLGVFLSTLGMYLLCVSHGFWMRGGDIIELVGAMFWGFQILLIDRYSKLVDGLKLSFLQFMVAGGLSLIFMLLLEQPKLENIASCMVPILYTGIIEVALCYTLQIIGQKFVPPVIAAVTLSLESVFAVIFGALMIQESVSVQQMIGMLLMLIAVIVIQIPMKKVFGK